VYISGSDSFKVHVCASQISSWGILIYVYIVGSDNLELVAPKAGYCKECSPPLF